jgi:hypothetical protein
MPQSPRSSRRQKIEPLNWAEAANAPALKGMTSFLDVSAEDVRNGTFDNFGPRRTVSTAVAVTRPEVEIGPGDETSSGYESIAVPAPRASRSPSVTPISARKPIAHIRHRRVETPPGAYIAPEDVSSPGGNTSLECESGAGSLPIETFAVDIVTPGRGRSKVRRCVLAQDGHSLGEEAIYQVMWRSGRAENGDPNSSRTIRIGAADLGYKVNMAKKNVRQNISRLFEKLAVEILEDFETMSSQARLYRVFSYKQILERRRAVGLEYVLRNKGVVFCTPSGEELVSSPAYVSTPGDETSIRPAPPKKRRASLPASNGFYTQSLPATAREGASESEELQTVIQALNRYWPVDQAAAVQLLRACRRARSDARADEIAFFVREKLELARQNRNITNPTGLILATVPQSFVGSAFEEFRKRMGRQATLVAEEQQRKERERADLTAWLLKEREHCETIASDASQSQNERDAAEKRLRQLSTWNP